MTTQIQYHFNMSIAFEDAVNYLGISEVEPKWRADFSRFDMSKLFYGMPDLEYDREAPDSFAG